MLNLQDVHLLIVKLENVTKLKTKQQQLYNFLKNLTDRQISLFLLCLDPKNKVKKQIVKKISN